MIKTSAVGIGSSKKLPPKNLSRSLNVGRHVFFKHGLDDRQVKVASGQMGMRQGYLDGHTTLGAPHIDKGRVFSPGEFCCDRSGSSHAEAGHGPKEKPQAVRVPVNLFEQTFATGLEFVLGLATFEPFGEVAPKRIESFVRHQQHTADVRVPGRLLQKYTLRDVKGGCLKEVVVRSYSKSPMD